MVQKGSGIASGQRSPGDEQSAAGAQLLRKPQTVIHHGYHAIDTDHIRPRCKRFSQGFFSIQKCAVDQLHVMPRFLQAGSNIGNAQGREPENRPIPARFEEGVNEQYGCHASFSILISYCNLLMEGGKE
jgi:hypothetical protein